MKWQERVLSSKAKRILVRVPRRVGKTYLAILWAAKQRGVVAYCTPLLEVIPYRAAKEILEDQIIHADDRSRILALGSGTVIQFYKKPTPGISCDAVVVDDADMVGCDLDHVLFPSTKPCLITGTLKKHLLKKAIPWVDDIHVYDIFDLSKEEPWGAEFLTEVQSIYRDGLTEWFGPWKKEVINNELYVSRLRE